jgi:hypothetical protein
VGYPGIPLGSTSLEAVLDPNSQSCLTRGWCNATYSLHAHQIIDRLTADRQCLARAVPWNPLPKSQQKSKAKAPSQESQDAGCQDWLQPAHLCSSYGIPILHRIKKHFNNSCACLCQALVCPCRFMSIPCNGTGPRDTIRSEAYCFSSFL